MRRERGFSLAELLMALLILSIVITTSMAAFVERSRRQKQARELILAYQALSNEAEYWRRMRYASLESDLSFQSDTSLLSGLGEHSTIVSVTETEPPNVKNVLLTIRWQNGKRQARLEIVRVDTGDPLGGTFW